MFNARAVCSIVNSDNSGFFFPQPSGFFGQEQECQLAQRHVSHQPQVVTPLVVIKTHLALDNPEQMLDGPAPKAHRQEFFQTRFGRGVGDEVFDFARGDIAGDN